MDNEQQIKDRYKALLKSYGLTDKRIGEWMGYSNKQSFNGAKRRMKVLHGIVRIMEHVKMVDKNSVDNQVNIDIGKPSA